MRSERTHQRVLQQQAPHQLPAGRHGLSRSYVEANQGQRMLAAVADVVSLKGYAALTVEDIVAAAGVSRKSFYGIFNDKEEAFLAAYDAISGELIQRVQAAYEATETFADAALACLAAFLEFAAADARYADICIVEVLAAGPIAIERHNRAMATFARLLHTAADRVAGRIRPPELTAETIIGGIHQVVYTRVLRGQTSELPKLLPDLAYVTMLPYLGHTAAERALTRTTARARSSPRRAAGPVYPRHGIGASPSRPEAGVDLP